jgi:hypothetical protein
MEPPQQDQRSVILGQIRSFMTPDLLHLFERLPEQTQQRLVTNVVSAVLSGTSIADAAQALASSILATKRSRQSEHEISPEDSDEPQPQDPMQTEQERRITGLNDVSSHELYKQLLLHGVATVPSLLPQKALPFMLFLNTNDFSALKLVAPSAGLTAPSPEKVLGTYTATFPYSRRKFKKFAGSMSLLSYNPGFDVALLFSIHKVDITPEMTETERLTRMLTFSPLAMTETDALQSVDASILQAYLKRKGSERAIVASSSVAPGDPNHQYSKTVPMLYKKKTRRFRKGGRGSRKGGVFVGKNQRMVLAITVYPKPNDPQFRLNVNWGTYSYS